MGFQYVTIGIRIALDMNTMVNFDAEDRKIGSRGICGF
jgi:hypothetical protein